VRPFHVAACMPRRHRAASWSLIRSFALLLLARGLYGRGVREGDGAMCELEERLARMICDEGRGRGYCASHCGERPECAEYVSGARRLVEALQSETTKDHLAKYLADTWYGPASTWEGSSSYVRDGWRFLAGLTLATVTRRCAGPEGGW
jgi:hypothetical protein